MKVKRVKPTILDFDEIHALDALDLYYEPMQISQDDKQRRRELAEFLADAFLFFFATFEVHREHQSFLSKQVYADMLADRISDAVTKVTGIDSYMSDHIREMSKQVVDTTFDKANKAIPSSSSESGPNNTNKPLEKNPTIDSTLDETRHITPQYRTESLGFPSFPEDSNQDNPDSDAIDDGSYWLSYRRAEDIGKSEANTFLNYTDYVDAKASGKTKKTWLTMLDNKVRQTHSEVEGQTIDIDAMFYVGDSLMRFPHDLSESPNPKEVIGCRCSVEYK